LAGGFLRYLAFNLNQNFYKKQTYFKFFHQEMISIYKQHFADILHKQTKLPLDEILALIEIPPENIP
jgi:hypothetical protein